MIIFDLDQTLVDTSSVEDLRRAQQWRPVMAKLDRLPVYAGVSRLLERLHGAGHALAIVTKSPDMIARKLAQMHGWPVEIIVGYHQVKRPKPNPDGLLLAAFLGGETLTELREAFLAADLQVTGGASARVAPMIQVRDAGGLLQRAGLALPVADVETHVVRYGDPFALMREIKDLGASNPLADRPRRLATPALLAAAATAYAERDSDADGRIRATLEIIWLSGWAPHESQQKPLKPGSATSRLGDVLARQIPGEKQ